MELFILTLSLLVVSVSLYYLISSKKLPPGPLSLPIAGSLFSIRTPLHRCFADLSTKHGPLVYLKLGMVPCIVANDAKSAEQVLRIHDAEFAYRPCTEFFRIFSFNWNDCILSPPDKLWKQLRRVSSVHLFSSKMLNTSYVFRKTELEDALDLVSQLSNAGKHVTLRRVFEQIISNSLCLTLFGKKDLELVDLIDSVANSGLTLNIGEVIPALDSFDLHGIYKRLKTEIMPRLEALIAEQVEEHRREKKLAGGSFVSKDFIDAILSLEDTTEALSEASTIALLFDMVVGGLETTKSTLEWTMAEIINDPRVMKKAQAEIDAVVGRTRTVEESDIPNLPYIQAIVKESLRMHPALPLGAPHYNPKEVKLDEYTVPAGCRVFVNLWAIGRDPKCWEEPNKFNPDRFLEMNISVSGKSFHYLPFSSGKRVCVGYPLAMRSVQFVIAAMVHKFDWNAVDDRISLEETKMTFSSKLDSMLVVTASPRM